MTFKKGQKVFIRGNPTKEYQIWNIRDTGRENVYLLSDDEDDVILESSFQEHELKAKIYPKFEVGQTVLCVDNPSTEKFIINGVIDEGERFLYSLQGKDLNVHTEDSLFLEKDKADLVSIQVEGFKEESTKLFDLLVSRYKRIRIEPRILSSNKNNQLKRRLNIR